MQYTRLGSTGTTVSRICLGTMTYGSKQWREWVLEEEESQPFFRRAVELGINFFDTADMYSLGASEEVLGRALKRFAPNRERVVIATKVFSPMGDDPNERGLSRKHIRHAIEGSLRRLGTDYVDLYQIHRFDPHTPIEETLEALDQVVREGKALYIGASSMYAWQFAKMLAASDRRGLERFVTMQNHYNLVYREEEREMIPLCRDEGVGLIPWSPLARGFLAGNRRPGDFGDTSRARTDQFAHSLYYRDEDFTVVERVREIAERHGVNNAQVALAWLLQKPGVTAPIIGASKMSHLEDAVAALDLALTDEEVAGLEEPYRPHPVLGHS
jgi:1-deoxyxylulose-5-phosphate synthase